MGKKSGLACQEQLTGFFKCLFIFTGAEGQAYSKAQSHYTMQPKTKKVHFF